MESWDVDNFQPPPVVPAIKGKWEGEDEDDDVKESWDDDEEVEQTAEPVTSGSKKPKKKKLEDIIAEKEAKKREEMERRAKLEEEITAEEKLRMQQESDLKIALETTFGDTNKAQQESSGAVQLPETKEQFDEFTESISKQLTSLSHHGNDYVNFAEALSRNLCAVMTSNDIRKVESALHNLYLEKQKIEKGDKGKKGKGKGKARLKMEADGQLSAYTDDYSNFNEYDDFM